MLQKLQNFAKFQKVQLDNLVDFENCCKTRIHLQRSAPIQPKTSEFCRKWQLPYGQQPLPRGSAREARRTPPTPCRYWCSSVPRQGAPENWQNKIISKNLNLTKFCKFMAGSFSAVSKRKFASKYAFDIIFQYLQDLHAFAPLKIQHFIKK